MKFLYPIIEILVGLLVWKFVPGLFSGVLSTIFLWAGIIIAILGAIHLIYALIR